MAYYRTQIKKTGVGYATDVAGKNLRFVGDYPCQPGDYVWTDGRIVFGNISRKPEPVIFDEAVSGVPVFAYYYDDDEKQELRGYFNSFGMFKKYKIRDCDAFTNDKKYFFRVSKRSDIFDEEGVQISTLDVFDADIAGSRLLTLRTENNGVADFLEEKLVPIHIYLNDSLRNTLYIDVNDRIKADIDDILAGAESDVRYPSDAPTGYDYRSILTQLLLGKIDSQGRYQLIFGTYVAADFTPNYRSPTIDPEVRFNPGENDIIIDFDGSCNIDDDFEWVKSKYTEENFYVDNDITSTDTERPYYAKTRNFRKKHDKYLIPAVMALFNTALRNPVTTFDIKAYHLDEDYIVPEYIPDIQSERFFAMGSTQDITELFHRNTVRYRISMDQGIINRASEYRVTPISIDTQDPEEPLRFNINPAGPIRVVGSGSRQTIEIPSSSFTPEQAGRPIATVIILKDFDDFGLDPALDGKSGVIYRYNYNDTPVMLDGTVLTYKAYPLVSSDTCGIVYNFFATWISVPFNDVISLSQTIQISFDGTDLSGNTANFNNWIINSDEFFYSYVDYSLEPSVDIRINKDLTIPYGVYQGEDWVIRSAFSINVGYDYETDIPEGGRWQPLENICAYRFKNGSYLIGIHGDKLFRLKTIDSTPQILGEELKNFRLENLKDISKTKR